MRKKVHYRVIDLFFLTSLPSLRSLLTPSFIAQSAQPFINKLQGSSCQFRLKIGLFPVGLLQKSVADWFSCTFSPATWDRGSSCPCFQLTLGLRVSKGGVTWVFVAQLQGSWEPQSLETFDVSNVFMQERVQKNHPNGDEVTL